MNPDTNPVASSATTPSASPTPVAAVPAPASTTPPAAKPAKGFGRKPKFAANTPKA